MPRLVLKFQSAALKEVPLGTRPVTIGRAPKINGVEIGGLTKLNDGDLIELGRVRLNFLFRE